MLPGGVTHDVRLAEPFPLAVSRARGSRKWDLDGHELVCYVMGHGALLLGHGHPEVIAAVAEQASRFLHPGACHELELAWAEAVVSMVPSAEKVRFTSSGTEASLLALRLARAATGRSQIVKLEGHFHGWHDQVALGSDPPYGPDSAGLPGAITDSVLVIPPEIGAVAAALASRTAAAVILEPSGASWGTVPLEAGFLDAVRRHTSETGTVLVFDEVVSGFRWSPGGVQAEAAVVPDMTVLGKILSGGLPGGAVCGRADVMDLLSPLADATRRVAHPGTHNAHPLSAVAGTTTLLLVRTGEAQRAAADRAEQLRQALSGVFLELGVAGRAYGESSTFHLLFGTDAEPPTLEPSRLKAPLDRRLSAALHCGMLLEGVHLFHGSGFVSTEHSEADLERTVEALRTTLALLAAEGLV